MDRNKFSEWLRRRDPIIKFVVWYIISVLGSIMALVALLTFRKQVSIPQHATWLQWHSPAIILTIVIAAIMLFMR